MALRVALTLPTSSSLGPPSLPTGGTEGVLFLPAIARQARIFGTGRKYIRDAILAKCPEVIVIEHTEKSSPRALDVAGEVKKLNAAIPIIIATTKSSEELAIGTLRAGLQDYVKLPSLPSAFFARIQKHPPLAPRSQSSFPVL